MNFEHNQRLLREKLLSHTISLRVKLKGSDEQLPYKNGYIRTLLDIEETLTSQALDLNRLRRDKFGISRMVDGTADTPIERELMLLHEELHDFIKASRELGDYHE
jgi:hypothetical protein